MKPRAFARVNGRWQLLSSLFLSSGLKDVPQAADGGQDPSMIAFILLAAKFVFLLLNLLDLGLLSGV